MSDETKTNGARREFSAAWRVTGLLAIVAICGGGDWLQFRSAESNSVAPGEGLPVTWKTDENIAWKAPLTGRGPSSPIVVGGRVIVTASSGVNQDRLHVLAFDATSGERIWERQFWATGRTLTHPTSANAAPTPASDGKLIFAFFSSNDLICLDLDGNLQWLRGLAHDFPRAGNDVGMASSPAVIGDTVVVQIQSQGESFAAGLNNANGLTRWRVDLEADASWTSPIVMRGVDGQSDSVLLQSPSEITAHEPTTGKKLWAYKASCQGIPSAVAEHGLVYVPAEGITSLKPAVETLEPSVLWKAPKIQPGAASPLVHNGRLYAVNRAGVATCADAASGEILSQTRLQGAFWGSPVLVGNLLYCISQEGSGQVVQFSEDGKKGEVIGKSEFGETIQSSPAVAGGAMYIRSDKHLWKVSAQKDAQKGPAR